MALRTSHPFRQASAALVAAALMACNDPSSVDSPYIVTPVTATTLSGTAGWTLTDTLVVEVRDFEGNLVPGAKVTWALPNGGRLAVQLADADDPMHGTADDRGRNYAVWTLGLREGRQVARAVAGLTGVPADFEAEAAVLHATQVSAGSGYTCAVLTDQRPVCWGLNRFGQLGTGDTLARGSPSLPLGLAAAIEIRASSHGTTCARDLSGDVWCWGQNRSGEAGPAAEQPMQLAPVRVSGAEGAASLAVSRYSYGGVGREFTCATLRTGGAKCWGDNTGGQLGTGDTLSSSSPRSVLGSDGFVSVYSGGARSCALDREGEAWCWGDAWSGSLSPLPAGVFMAPVRPIPGRLFYSLAMGEYSQCGLQAAGRVSCWGEDWKFALGTSLPRGQGLTSTPVRPDLGEEIAELASNGGSGIYARSRFGWGFMWGDLGNDAVTAPAEQITSGIRIISITASYDQYCVLSESGGLYCGTPGWWGYWGGYGVRPQDLRGIPDSLGR